MNTSSALVRVLVILLSFIFMMAFALGQSLSPTLWTYLGGLGLGALVSIILVGCDLLFKRFNLRAFNVGVLGLFFGYLMGYVLTVIFKALLEMSSLHPSHPLAEAVIIFLFLFGIYLGLLLTIRASNEIYVSIPFIKFTPDAKHIQDILPDLSALGDLRLIDLCASGLLDKRLVIPRFLLKEFYQHEEEGDEAVAFRAKRALDVIKKLESLPALHVRYHDIDFPDIKEPAAKVLRLARLLDADVLTADLGRIQMSQQEGLRFISLNALSNALKPLMQKGEFLRIKIQRYGKEELQGVGYLDDGTMVVVNGGGDYIGETVTARVLSVKHTSSGRIIFCNVGEEDLAQ